MYKGYHLYRVDQGNSWTWQKDLLFDIESGLDEVSLLNGNLKLSAGKAGSFEFTINRLNTEYNILKPFLSYIDIYRNNEIIFSGRVLRPVLNFDTTKSFEVEGNLAIFNDTILRPMEFRSDTSQLMTLDILIEKLLDNHNSQVPHEKQILKGNIEVDAGEHIYRKYENYKTTYERLNDLVDSYGGYLQVTRHNDQKLYLDWLVTTDRIASQTIDFGENILDLTVEQNIDDVFSVIIPLGAEVENEETGESEVITIAPVSPDGLDYIQNETGLTNYGRIVKVITWDDVEDPLTLYNKAHDYLEESVGISYKISVNAIDLANVRSFSNPASDGYEEPIIIRHLNLLDRVRVRSIPHNLKDDEQNSNVFEILELNLDLLNPEADNFALGKTTGNYISNNVSKINNYATILDNVVKNYAVNKSLVDKLTASYESIINQMSYEISTRVTSILTSSGGMVIDESTVAPDSVLGRIIKNESQIVQTADRVMLYLGITDSDGTTRGDAYIAKYFEFTSDGFTIFNPSDTIYLEQSNDHWSIKNGSLTLLKGDINGLTAQSVDVKAQLTFSNGEISQWAIRKGKYISAKVGTNFNDIWIGG